MLHPKFFPILFLISRVNSQNDNMEDCKLDRKQIVSADNIERLSNCTIVEGTLHITNDTLNSIHIENLKRLKSIRTIKGNLIITANHQEFSSLSFLENLESIVSTGSGKSGSICIIIANSSLRSIDLPKIKDIHCYIIVKDNNELCYSEQWFHNGIITEKNIFKSIVTDNAIETQCLCNEQCRDKKCWGPEPDQCYNCKNIQINTTTNGYPSFKCIEHNTNKIKSLKDVESCRPPQCKSGCAGPHFYINGECKACNVHCKIGCVGPESNQCYSCKHVQNGEYCVAKCPQSKYNNNGYCQDCNIECKDGCKGPGASECNSCKHIQDGENCVVKCSEATCEVNGECRSCDNQPSSINNLIIGIVIAILLTAILISIWIWFKCRKEIMNNCRKTNQKEIHLTKPLLEHDSSLSQLPIIKESEIYKSKILGQGAFGIVHEAIWKPECTTNKVPVAVKILHKNSTIKSIKEFLDEAIIMATMDHPNVVHLIAVCVTTEVMLLTKLMPLGCLLNYVRSQKHHITPKSLLAWSTQIAKGMSYLEEKHLVHRDLAARNVLLETVDCIKISDFGLSKYVGTNELGSNTKFPIKWLALECLEEKRFTHKSDVWAFGVTIWELLTFGDRPFENIKGRNLPTQLKLGLKLPQPHTCNADVYATLIRCWLLIPELRPDFLELQTTLRHMSYEATKYVTGYGNGQFKKLNLPEEVPSNLPYKNSVHVTMDTLQNNVPGQQQIQVLDLKHLRSSVHRSASYDREGYLEPSAHLVKSRSDSGYNSICNFPTD